MVKCLCTFGVAAANLVAAISLIALWPAPKLCLNQEQPQRDELGASSEVRRLDEIALDLGPNREILIYTPDTKLSTTAKKPSNHRQKHQQPKQPIQQQHPFLAYESGLEESVDELMPSGGEGTIGSRANQSELSEKQSTNEEGQGSKSSRQSESYQEFSEKLGANLRNVRPFCAGSRESEHIFSWDCQGFPMTQIPADLKPKPTSL